MMQVANHSCVRRVAMRSLRAFRTRNIIAVLAIALTTMLFTALFAVAISVNDSFQQSNFLMSGGDEHGDFKNLTKEELEKLKKDPLIKEADARLFVGIGAGDAFRKTQVEVSYMDPNAVKHYFCTPKYGHLPKEGTNQAMTDTRVLKLLGIQAKVGQKFTITYEIERDDGKKKEVTEQFVLCGWWDYNEVSNVSHVIVPQDYAKKILQKNHISSEDEGDKWTLGVKFSNSFHIEKNMRQVIENQGFQSTDASKENYIKFGVNWGYTNTQSDNHLDAESIFAMVILLLLIVFTGYLVIYNVFQISVTNDIRFYGLLKTIGMTGKQMKRMIRQQALCLSVIGIPIGLLGGTMVGKVLIPLVIRQLNCNCVISRVHLGVLVGAALFSLITVLISCCRPGKIVAKVSPIVACGYTGQYTVTNQCRRKKNTKASLFSMAWANIGRNKKKTMLVVASLSLAVVLLNLTCTLANGFDMNLYLQQFCVSDFVFANADYFNIQKGFKSQEQGIEEPVIEMVLAQQGIKKSGKVYGQTNEVQEKIHLKDVKGYFKAMGYNMTKEEIKMYEDNVPKAGDGMYYDSVQLYGMDQLPLEKCIVVKGDISALMKKDSIAAVYMQDDYNNVVAGSNWAKIGDQVTLRYAETEEKATEKTYTVVCEIMVPNTESYRYYTGPQFVLGSDSFLKDAKDACVMNLLIDMEKLDAAKKMEQFLKQYTENENPVYDYESKFSYEQEFDSFRSMYVILGSVLSAVIAVVGILNFLNSILTGMIARRKEFAVLQSIGMTRRQLQEMLIIEGLLYTVAAVVVSLVLVLVLEPVAGKLAEQMFWFFRFRYMISPVLFAAVFFVMIGVTVPIIVYHFAGRHTIVEQLRESE